MSREGEHRKNGQSWFNDLELRKRNLKVIATSFVVEGWIIVVVVVRT